MVDPDYEFHWTVVLLDINNKTPEFPFGQGVSCHCGGHTMEDAIEDAINDLISWYKMAKGIDCDKSSFSVMAVMYDFHEDVFHEV